MSDPHWLAGTINRIGTCVLPPVGVLSLNCEHHCRIRWKCIKKGMREKERKLWIKKCEKRGKRHSQNKNRKK